MEKVVENGGNLVRKGCVLVCGGVYGYNVRVCTCMYVCVCI